ncbi:MAG: peptide ABC transporter substrate-binding protein [Clostridiaceae bacterium]|nr:peptide ABC transporter substrate-binding protein [Clostridiaceae bacterium]MBW4860383.1 peptide ABC transporter substrate-binding protein [Clostridiaceae bacterium]MBW4867170.1 peptide ABC transporter substrate-binding protein [Clostridiaceae bacterium]
MRKQKWLLLLLVLVLTLSLALTGCGKQDKPEPAATDDNQKEEAKGDSEEKLAEEQILRVNWSQEPPDLDPQTTTDQVSFWIINATYEGLVRLDADGNVQPGLAEKWDEEETEDGGVKYTFHLRDAQWSDGTPITAEDFEYSWFKAIDPEVAAEYSYQLTDTAGIKNAAKFFAGEIKDKEEVGIKAVDEKTFEVELERDIPFFLSLTSFPTFIPAQKAALEEFGDAFASEADKMVYSGPFVISEWEHEQKLNLKKNEKYWDAENVKLEEIHGDMITENNTAINLYETGDLDVTGVAPEFLDNYKDSEEFENLAEATTWYIQYNCEDKYLKNQNLRYALSLAIDKQSFVDNVLANGSIVAEGLTPTLLPGKDGKEFAENRGNILPKYDPEKAKEYLDKGLEELGITKEELEKHLTFLTGESDVAKKQAAAIQNMWKQNLGIEAEIETVAFKIRIDRYNRKDYTTTFAGWGGDYNDPLTFMDLWVTDGGNNDTGWGNEKYDEAIKKAIEGEGDERIDAMIEAEKVLAEELPIIPIYYNARNFVEKPHVKGIARFPVGADTDYKWAYIIEH